VVRQEKGQLRRYAHIGTGNYNPKTARIYEDLGLLTADPDVGADLTDLFNTLTGYSRQTEYRTLMVAPHGVRAGLVERIEQQARAAEQGRPSRVRLKANSIVDEAVIDALYRASRVGVPVQLLVAASARCGRGSRGCRRPSRCAASSGASSSTRG
jgi:polyphosphate kinase